jgi:L-fuconolactonase
MFDQLHRGDDEPILDAGLPIVDAHHHLFVRPTLRYLLDDYLADARAGHRILASVYVETGSFARPHGPEVMRPLGEVEFANGVGAMTASGVLGDERICAAIVGDHSAGFVPLWNALKHAVRSASSDEKAALFHDTAARVYRIQPVEG